MDEITNDKIIAYFRDKIEQGALFYETRARSINNAYLAEVEKLAKRTDDWPDGFFVPAS